MGAVQTGLSLQETSCISPLQTPYMGLSCGSRMANHPKRMVRNISSGSSSTTVYPEATNGNSLYFFVYSGGNKEFWITDGTEAGTLQSPVVSSQLSIYSDVVLIDNAYYLIAINPTNSTTDLYKLVDGQPHSPTHGHVGGGRPSIHR